MSRFDSKTHADAGGPEFEELFSPTVEAFSTEMLSGPNAGFLPEATGDVVVIFVTDADDSSPDVSPAQLARYLNSVKPRGARLSTYGVLAPLSDPGCKKDYGAVKTGPARIQEFLELTDGKEFSLCAPDFGEKLASIGKDISDHVLSKIVPIPLSEIDKTIVTYGGHPIPQATPGNPGWHEVPGGIQFGPDIQWPTNVPDDTKIEIRYFPINIEGKGAVRQTF